MAKQITFQKFSVKEATFVLNTDGSLSVVATIEGRSVLDGSGVNATIRVSKDYLAQEAETVQATLDDLLLDLEPKIK